MLSPFKAAMTLGMLFSLLLFKMTCCLINNTKNLPESKQPMLKNCLMGGVIRTLVSIKNPSAL